MAAECSSYRGDSDTELRALYYYALLAEAADTGTLPRWDCTTSDEARLGAPQIHSPTPAGNTDWNSFAGNPVPSCAFDTPPPCIRRLTSTDLEEGLYGWNDIVLQFRNRGKHIGVYESPFGGPAYIVCDSSPSDVFVLVTLARFGLSSNEDLLRRWVLRPMLWVVDNTVADETLDAVTFQKNDVLSNNVFPQTVTAIRGTRPDRLSHWQASLQRFFGSSCVFDLMVKVARGFMGEGHSHYAVTGHSLGGAVAQHVAQRLDGSSTAGRFQAFAFNALGTDGQVDHNVLQSFFIQADPIAAFGNFLSRVQAGRSMCFIPPNTDFWASEAPPYWPERHSLHSVQRALCECMQGMGNLIVDPSY